MWIIMPDTNYVLVPVGRKGHVAAVDEADWERVRWRRWSLQKTPGGNLYAATSLYRGSVGMHRFLMECDDPALVVDHRDGCGLNNRRYNLREATHAQNVMNREVGVSWVELRRLWRVTVGDDVTYYRDREAADTALSLKARAKYGEFSRLT
jgi:hypothetical protein